MKRYVLVPYDLFVTKYKSVNKSGVETKNSVDTEITVNGVDGESRNSKKEVKSKESIEVSPRLDDKLAPETSVKTPKTPEGNKDSNNDEIVLNGKFWITR